MSDLTHSILLWFVAISLVLLVLFNWPTPRKKLQDENNFLREINAQYEREIKQLEDDLGVERKLRSKYKLETDKRISDLEKMILALSKIYGIDNPKDLIK